MNKKLLFDKNLPRKVIAREAKWYRRFFDELFFKGVLSKIESQVLYWHKIMGLKQSEVAERLNLSIDQVKKAVSRGKKKLIDKADNVQEIWEDIAFWHDIENYRLRFKEEEKLKHNKRYKPTNYPDWKDIYSYDFVKLGERLKSLRGVKVEKDCTQPDKNVK